MSTGLRFTLEVDGLPPDAFAVVSFHLNQSLSSLFSLDLSLVSQQFLSLEFAQVLDKMAYLTIWQGDEVQRRVKGVVTWFELGENDKNQMLYSMKVHPPLWRAGLRQNFRIFQNEDIKSILGTMLQENGVTEWSPLFSEPHPSREFCVQYGETDYDFLCRMAAEEGIFFYEEHAYKSTDQSLVLCDTVRHLPESFEIPWNPNTRTEVSTLCISQFRYSAQIRPSSVVTKDYTFKRPGWAGRFEQEGQHQDYQRTQYEVYDYPGRFKSAHGQNFARWQMDGWRNNAETARGMSRSPEIWPGRRIVLTGHPQANLNREWQVVASELHGEQPQAVPGRQGAGTALENHFAVIPADRTWRPQPLLKPLVDGPQSAVVTGPAGEEIFCDEHGRVRVKFNWDRYNPADQDSSCWIRVAQAWAGTGFGHLAIPRVGQEVIVDFLNGDPDQPIIMGRTYHQENRTPGSLPGTKTQMTIRSKTYMGSGFNELKFDDATVREQVYIHAQKNMDTEVLNDRTTTVKHDHRETVKNDQTVTIQEGNRLLTVEKGHKITGVLKGSLSEDVFQDRGTIAGSVHVDAVNNGGEGDGIQAYVNQRLDDMPATQHYARLVIDDIDNQALITPLTPEQNQQRFNFRRLHEEVGRRWTFSFDSSIGLRSGAMSTANNNVGGAAPGKSYRSYGQLEAEYRIGRNMLLEGDLLSVYSRVFADTGENGVMMPVKNPMSGTGLRWKPLRDQIFFLAVEQQLPLNGQNGASDTMLRASASFFNGGKYSDEWHPNGSGWFAQNLYLDAAQYIRQDIQAWTADYRVSWHQKVANGQTIEPYAHVQDNGYRDKGTQGAQLGGVGVRWNIWTGETHYDAWPHKVSLGVEYQHTFKAINQRNGERNNAFLTIGVHW